MAKAMRTKREAIGHSIPCDYDVSGASVGGSFYLYKAFQLHNKTGQTSVHIKVGYGIMQDQVEARIRAQFETMVYAGAMPFEVIVVLEAPDY